MSNYSPLWNKGHPGHSGSDPSYAVDSAYCGFPIPRFFPLFPNARRRRASRHTIAGLVVDMWLTSFLQLFRIRIAIGGDSFLRWVWGVDIFIPGPLFNIGESPQLPLPFASNCRITCVFSVCSYPRPAPPQFPEIPELGYCFWLILLPLLPGIWT